MVFGSDGFGSDVIWFGWFWFGLVLVRKIQSEQDLVRTEPNLVGVFLVRTIFCSYENTSIWGPNLIWFVWVRCVSDGFGFRCNCGSDGFGVVRVPMQLWFGWVKLESSSESALIRVQGGEGGPEGSDFYPGSSPV